MFVSYYERWKKKGPAGCVADWSRRSHYGGFQMNAVQTWEPPNNSDRSDPTQDIGAEWTPVKLCREHAF